MWRIMLEVIEKKDVVRKENENSKDRKLKILRGFVLIFCVEFDYFEMLFVWFEVFGKVIYFTKFFSFGDFGRVLV